MTSYTGTFSGSGSTSGDGDEAYFLYAVSGGVTYTVATIDQFGDVSGTASITASLTGNAVGESDGDSDNVSGSGSGSLTTADTLTGVDDFWTFSDGGYAEFVGSFNTAQTQISGTLFLGDQGVSTSVPLTLYASGTASTSVPTSLGTLNSIISAAGVAAAAYGNGTLFNNKAYLDFKPDPPPLTVTLVNSNGQNETWNLLADLLPGATAPVSNASNYFQAVAYQSPDHSKIIVSFEGTASLENLLTDAATWGTGSPSAIFVQDLTAAANFLKAIANIANTNGAQVELTGHSLGGAFAQLLGLASGYDTTVFNAPGAAELLANPGVQAALQIVTGLPGAPTPGGNLNVNIRDQGDLVSLVGSSIGNQATITSSAPGSSIALADTDSAILRGAWLNNHSIATLISNLQQINNPANGTSITLGVVESSGVLNFAPTLVPGTPTAGNHVFVAQAGAYNSSESQISTYSVTVSNGTLSVVLPPDPPAKSRSIFTVGAGSPTMFAIGFPDDSPYVSSVKIWTEAGNVWSAPQTISTGTLFTLPANLQKVEYELFNASGQIALLPDGYPFDPLFTDAGLFTGALEVINVPATPTSDFSGAGTADILLRNTGGATGIDLMSNGTISSSASLGTFARNWTVAGVADFSGDGTDDILWRDTSGDVGIDLMSNGTISSWTSLGTIVPIWTVLGAADFNGDGTDDILLRSTSGALGIDLMSNGTVSSWASIGTIAANWTMLGVGDFNGDGTADILWRDAVTGATGIDLMRNGTVSSWTSPGTISPVWTVLGIGDFNGDGIADILWRNVATGAIGIDLMSNGTVAGWASLGTLAANDPVLRIGDYNGDGTADILWRNVTNGAAGVDIISNGTLSAVTSLGTIGTDWSALGAPSRRSAATGADLNGDGEADILWHNANGALGIDLIANGSATGWTSLGTVTSAWSILAIDDYTGDGNADILFGNAATGDTGIDLIANGAATGWLDLGNAAPTWSVLGSGDFTGNGIADILWRNTAGATGIELMQNGAVTGWSSLGTIAPDWQMQGIGDFNGDGIADLLWRSATTGAAGIDLMQNGAVTGWSSIGTISTAWQVLGSGDFTGNGIADILWRNTTNGDTGIELMQNGAATGWADLGIIASSWSVAQIGDFNGDGISDILWHDSSGLTGIAIMKNAAVASWSSLGTITTDWSVAKTGSVLSSA